MALDAETSALLDANIVLNHKQRVGRATFVHQTLAQQLSTIHNNLIHQHGAVTDDPASLAMLQTAAGAPRQGAANRPA